LHNFFYSDKWWHVVFSPLPKSVHAGFIAGSNWISSASYWDSLTRIYPIYPINSIIGVKADGTLWHSVAAEPGTGGERFEQIGNETNWVKIARTANGILLLKNNGTLWVLDDSRYGWWLVPLNLVQTATDSKWTELYSAQPGYIRKSDGTVWFANYYYSAKNNSQSDRQREFLQETNLDQVDFGTLSFEDNGLGYVRADGTLWVGQSLRYSEENSTAHLSQVGKDTNWQAVAVSYHMMVALKNDGSLWQWNSHESLYQSVNEIAKAPPTRLGIHSDWVAVVNTWGGIVTLAADGSLWLWPDKQFYDYGLFIKLPKQPRFLGNVFSKGE
jgi:hypothetical protein